MSESASRRTPTAAGSEGGSSNGRPVEISIRFRNLTGANASALTNSLHQLLQQQQQQQSQNTGSQSTTSGTPALATALPPSLSQLLSLARGAAPAAADGATVFPPFEGFAGFASAPSTAAAGRLSEQSNERPWSVQRISGAVAGSIFSDLVNGALRPGDVGPPPASEKAINDLPRCEPVADAQVSTCHKCHACLLVATPPIGPCPAPLLPSLSPSLRPLLLNHGPTWTRLHLCMARLALLCVVPSLIVPACSHNPQCPVCLCGIEDDATKMPCGHMYHSTCLTKWLRSHNTCPVCRATVEADETRRPSSLSALLNGWRESRARAEAAGAADGSAPPLPSSFSAQLSDPVLVRAVGPSSSVPLPPPPSESEVSPARAALWAWHMQALIYTDAYPHSSPPTLVPHLSAHAV